LSAAGVHSARGEEIWTAYSSFADGGTRAAFLRTLRSVVDYRGQTVSALNRLHVRAEVPTLLIWGEQDQIIPVEHAYAAQNVRAGSHLEVLPGIGHFPQVESPADVTEVIEAFLAASINPADDVTVKPRPGTDTAEVDPLYC
jgi:pimeloyl-ACP methyl ester carboxylesterase